MLCTYCGEVISSKPIKQNDLYYCSLECANLDAGLASEEAEEYYEEDVLESSFEEYDE